MSTTVSVSHYEYQGQVYSPAFSEPSSPMSTSSSNPPSPRLKQRDFDEGDFCEFQSKAPRFANKYEEMLQPLSPVTTLPYKVIQPQMTVRQTTDQLLKLQNEFESVITNGDIDKVEDFLSKHSTDININLYNSEGRTALQQSCADGRIDLARSLVKFGADHRLTNRDGFSTLQIAVFSGHSNLIMYILSLSSSRHT